MRLHRFYINPETKLAHQFWLHDQALVHQWRKVLRFQKGQELILFDGEHTERLYRLEALNETEAKLTLLTDYQRQVPIKDVYLLWSLLKRDKNDWVLQKATELGVRHFVPLLPNRSVAVDFDAERAQKIVIEASEQCGRSDIPRVREPMLVTTALKEFATMPLYVAEQGSDSPVTVEPKLGVLIGPEGGWAPEERTLFKSHELAHIGLGNFTLRAETAAIVASAKILL